jgi:hypothetical protein
LTTDFFATTVKTPVSRQVVEIDAVEQRARQSAAQRWFGPRIEVPAVTAADLILPPLASFAEMGGKGSIGGNGVLNAARIWRLLAMRCARTVFRWCPTRGFGAQ